MAPDPIPLNQWTHVAGTIEGTVGRIYINGQPVATNPAMSVAAGVNRTRNYIGRSNWNTDGYADGQFDELRIWDFARSEQDIQADMYHELTGAEAGLVAYYRFDGFEDLGVGGDGADDVCDLSPNGRHGDSVHDPTIEWHNLTPAVAIQVELAPGPAEGTLRLDVSDDNSIINSASEPLGGPAAGDGDFAAGEAFTIDNVPPSVAINLLSPSPTGADSVDFEVTFHEPVAPTFTTVGFAGSLAAGATADITGTDPTYLVTVTLADPDADGTLGITVGTEVTDAAGNACAGGASDLCTIHNWSGFTAHPASAQLYEGDSHTLMVAANQGIGAQSYQWKWDDAGAKVVHDVGEDAPQYIIEDAALAVRGAYWCAVTYDGVPHASNTATLEVEEHLEITQHPVGGAKYVNDPHIFSIAATGGYSPLAYVWYKDGGPLGNGSTYAIASLQQSDSGAYWVQISDANTAVLVSNTAVLQVTYGIPAASVVGLGVLVAAIALGAAATFRKRP